MDQAVGGQRGLQGGTPGRVRHDPDDGREQAIAGLVATAGGVALVDLGLTHHHRRVLGSQIGFQEPVILVVAAGGDDVQVGLEPLQAAVRADERAPARRLGLHPDQLDRAPVLQLVQSHGELGHGQGVGGERR